MKITENFKKALQADSIGPKGYIIAYDKKNQNKMLIDQHNMILKDGRNFIYNLFASGYTNTIEETRLVRTAMFTNETKDVKFDDILPIGNNIFTYEIPVAPNMTKYLEGQDQSGADGVQVLQGEIDNHKYICFQFIISQDSLETSFSTFAGNLASDAPLAAISSLYLVLSDTSGSNPSPFSRIVFDPIPIADLEELTLNYYIYF